MRKLKMSDDLIKAEVLMVAKELAGLGDGTIEPAAYDEGMCYHIDLFAYNNCIAKYFYIEIDEKIEELTLRWPKFNNGDDNNDIDYPIWIEGVHTAETQYKLSDNKWADTPYGNLRKEYCTYLAVELRKFAKEEL